MAGIGRIRLLAVKVASVHILGLLWLLVLAVLHGIVDVGEDEADRVFTCDVEGHEGDHAKVFDLEQSGRRRDG